MLALDVDGVLVNSKAEVERAYRAAVKALKPKALKEWDEYDIFEKFIWGNRFSAWKDRVTQYLNIDVQLLHTQKQALFDPKKCKCDTYMKLIVRKPGVVIVSAGSYDATVAKLAAHNLHSVPFIASIDKWSMHFDHVIDDDPNVVHHYRGILYDCTWNLEERKHVYEMVCKLLSESEH